MGCGSSKIAGNPSVGTDNNDQPAKPRKSWIPKIEIPPAEGQMMAHHAIDSNPKTDWRMADQNRVSAFVGTADQRWKTIGTSAAVGPVATVAF